MNIYIPLSILIKQNIKLKKSSIKQSLLLNYVYSFEFKLKKMYFIFVVIFRFHEENLEIKKNILKSNTFFIYKYNLFDMTYNFT